MARYNSDLQRGDYVLLGDDEEGYIRYIGKRCHQRGIWYGVELIIGTGTNDGSENGDRYFLCDPYKGIFVRSWNIKSILSNKPRHSITHHAKSHKKQKKQKKQKKHNSSRRPPRSPRGHPKPPKSPKSPLQLSKSPQQKPRKRQHSKDHDGSRSKSYANIEKQRNERHRHSVRSAMTKALKSRQKPKRKKKSRHGSAQVQHKRVPRSNRKHKKQKLSSTTSHYNPFLETTHKSPSPSPSGHVMSRSVGQSVTNDLGNTMFDLAAILDSNPLNDAIPNEPIPQDAPIPPVPPLPPLPRKSGKKFKPAPAKSIKKPRAASSYKNHARITSPREHKKRKTNPNYRDRNSDSDTNSPPRRKKKSVSNRRNYSDSDSDSPPRRKKKSVSNRRDPSRSPKWKQRQGKSDSNRKYSDSDSPPPIPHKQRKSVSNYYKSRPKLEKTPRSPASPVLFSRKKNSKKWQKSVSNRPRFASPQPKLKKKRHSGPSLMRVASPPPITPHRKSASNLRRPAPPPPAKRKSASSRPTTKRRPRFASPQPIQKTKPKKSDTHRARFSSLSPRLEDHRKSASMVLPPQIKIAQSVSFSQHDRLSRMESPAHKYRRRDLATDLNQIQNKKHRVRAWSSDSLTYAPKKKETAHASTNEDTTKSRVGEGSVASSNAPPNGWKCAQCLRINEIEFKFCPNCGGKRPIDSMELKQASDSEERDESEDEDDHSHSLRQVVQSSMEILNDMTPKPITKHKSNKELDRLNKDDFIKTFEEMKHEIKQARSLSLKSKPLAIGLPTKTGNGKPKNGRFSFSIKNWIKSPRGGKKSPKTARNSRGGDDIEHSVSNSDVSFAYSIGKGRGHGGYHVEDRITAFSRYNQQTVEFMPDTPEFTPHQTPKIKAMDEFVFNDSVAVGLCQSPTPEIEMEPIDVLMEDHRYLDLDHEDDEKVKEKEDKRRRKKKKKPPKSRKKRKKKKAVISPPRHETDEEESDIDLF